MARALISNSFDVLNHFVLSTVIGKQTDSEIKMDIENLKQIKALNLPFEIIRVKDRGYVSLKDIYYSNILNDKYVTRLTKSNFKKEILSMESNDEIIEIPYEKHRALYYKNSDPEFYEILKTKPSIFVRIVKIKLSTGEIETLITNLSKEEVTTEEMNELYNLRWQIELNYHLLKESLKIETITSSKEELIKQDIYSQMLVFNLLQIFVSEAEKEINQSQYKHKMKINNNMATGFLKKALIIMLIEEDPVKQNNIIDALVLKIKKYIVPIRDGRSYPRNKNRDKNRYSITKRKSF